MIGYICSAITDFVVTFADDSDIVNLHNWSMGSFSGITWDNVAVIWIVISTAAVCVFLMSKPISAYQMGEAYAKNMGLNIPLFRALLVLLSSILSACVAAFAGPVSFVGIAVPASDRSVSVRYRETDFDDSGLFPWGAPLSAWDVICWPEVFLRLQN